MSKLAFGVVVLLFSVFISAVSQIILKVAANKQYDSPIKEYVNIRVIGAYGMFFLSMLLTMLALRYVPLSLSPVIESTSYIYVALIGYFFLKEKMSKRKIAGLALILTGIFIYSF